MENLLGVGLTLVFLLVVLLGSLVHSFVVIVPAIGMNYFVARSQVHSMLIKAGALAALVCLYQLLPSAEIVSSSLAGGAVIIDGIRLVGLAVSYALFLVACSSVEKQC